MWLTNWIYAASGHNLTCYVRCIYRLALVVSGHRPHLEQVLGPRLQAIERVLGHVVHIFEPVVFPERGAGADLVRGIFDVLGGRPPKGDLGFIGLLVNDSGISRWLRLWGEKTMR